jgi:aspartyl-tRNA synthetase
MDQNWQRTITCGALRASDNGKKVILNGWVARARNHGGLLFLSLRDRYGVTQITINEQENPTLFAKATDFKMEYCLAVGGKVALRAESEKNPDMTTGEIEVIPHEIVVLNTSGTLPFMIKEEGSANDTARLEYRYLGLRNDDLQGRLRLRSRLSFLVHRHLQEKGFIDVETPTLVKSTPEGARDFIVPSRMHKGSVFALAQSPQLFKQLLMMGGLDRYYQIARCYRDEDPRGDRQAEFTQIDLEMAFITEEDIMDTTEALIKDLFKEGLGLSLPTPFPRISYEDAMMRYGSDKPDIRFDLTFKNVTRLSRDTEFTPFLESPVVVALVYRGDLTRKQLSELEEVAKTYGLASLGYVKVRAGGVLETGLAKYISNAPAWANYLSLEEGNTVLIGFGQKKDTVLTALGQVRLAMGRMFDLINTQRFAFVWVNSFPLFEQDTDTGGWVAKHHMFTRPQPEFFQTLESDPENVLGELYDLVCNGWELGSGSIRIHERDLQQRIFDLVGFSAEKAEERFGYFLDAMTYGAPPHGGIALGFDRLIALLTHQPNIREVLAFPRNSFMASPLDGSPAPTEEISLQEAGIAWLPREPKNEK